MFPVFNPSSIWFQKGGSCEDAKIGAFVLLHKRIRVLSSVCTSLTSEDGQTVGAIKAKKRRRPCGAAKRQEVGWVKNARRRRES